MLAPMSEADLADLTAEWARTDRHAYFEQRIFVLSPLGDFWTALAVFLLLGGAFIAIAGIEHLPLVTRVAKGIAISGPAETAFALDVTLSVALYIQRYTRMRERKDYPAFVRTLNPGAIEKHNVVMLTPAKARLAPATWVGLFGGIIASPLLYSRYLSSPVLPGIFAWFLVVTTLLGMAFTRGVELSRTGTKNTNLVIGEELKVDLLRIDHLSVWGRSAARFALIWFTVGAVSCLFFLDSGLNIFTVALVVLFLALGAWVFLRTMEPVHRKIRAVKTEELERIRSEIDSVRPGAKNDASAAARLQSLLAYETRIAAAPEWPFDQTTIVRVGASALILTVPWFGQAIAQFAIDHLAH
jgi:hypothetical protein